MTEYMSEAGGTPGARVGRRARWRGALDVLEALRSSPGLTRAELARRAGLSSGAAAELTAQLRELGLLDEQPAPVTGRGRPTTVLVAHPRGPLVLAIDLRHEDWRLALVGIDGRTEHADAGRHARRQPAAVVRMIRAAVGEARERSGDRVRVASISVAGTVAGDRLVQASGMGWGAVDLRALVHGPSVPVLVGNDATLGGVAEARRGAGVGARAVLHLVVEVGLGGILVAGGRPVTGATGAGGEFGHLPLGDPALACPCGAHGCWDLLVDGRAMARHLGEPAPENARSFARAVLARAPADAAALRAVQRCAADLGRGAAGLVNALDPDVVTLGGLAPELRDAAPDAFAHAFSAGLMSFRRARPPEVRTAQHGEDGPLRGAAEVGLDHLLTEDGLAAWAAGAGAPRG